jgi:hypothetical protein
MACTMYMIDNTNTLMNQIESRDNFLKALPKPQPFRLVMIKCKDFCQFCDDPKDDVFIHYITVEHKYGFLSCEKCRNKATDAVNEWFATEAWGDVNYLGHKNIKVKRSSGIIEDDWKLDKERPFIETINESKVVHCIKDDGSLTKCCFISDIVEWNDEKSSESHKSTSDTKNLVELLQNTKLL